MMPSLPQLLIVLAIVVIIFGLGKFPKIASDLAKGIKSFKKGMSDDSSEEKPSISENKEEMTVSSSEKADKKDA